MKLVRFEDTLLRWLRDGGFIKKGRQSQKDEPQEMYSWIDVICTR